MTSLQAFPVLHSAAQTAIFSSRACPSGMPPMIHCTLPAGCAITLRARQAGVLRVQQGGVWLTFGNAGCDGRTPAHDDFLESGDSLRLDAGQSVVAEFWRRPGMPGEMPACLTWQAAASVLALPGPMAAGWCAVLGLATQAIKRFNRPGPDRRARPQRLAQPLVPLISGAAPAVRYLPPTCSPG